MIPLMHVPDSCIGKADGPLSEALRAAAPQSRVAAVLILVRDSSGGLSLAARNDLVVLCKNCGGAFGEPFEGVVIKGSRFTVMNYGGSADRWSYSYTFDFSRRDRTWQVVRVEELDRVGHRDLTPGVAGAAAQQHPPVRVADGLPVDGVHEVAAAHRAGLEVQLGIWLRLASKSIERAIEHD